MAKWNVRLDDQREIAVYAPDEEGAKKQANHAEKTRLVIATKRGHDIKVELSHAISAMKIKD